MGFCFMLCSFSAAMTREIAFLAFGGAKRIGVRELGGIFPGTDIGWENEHR
jgi:hypothetical protein